MPRKVEISGLSKWFGELEALRKIDVAVRMPAELQPRVQLAMVRQQHAFAVGADEPC